MPEKDVWCIKMHWIPLNKIWSGTDACAVVIAGKCAAHFLPRKRVNQHTCNFN